MHQVIFFSRGGNTKKLADAIASQLGAKACAVTGATLGLVSCPLNSYSQTPVCDTLVVNVLWRGGIRRWQRETWRDASSWTWIRDCR